MFTVYTPGNAASGSFDYELPIGTGGMSVMLHMDANYSDPTYSFQNENVQTESAFIVNARLALADVPLMASGTRATLSVWARNLFNEDHIYRRSNANSSPTVNNDGSLNYSGVLGDYGNFNPPRTFGVQASINF